MMEQKEYDLPPQVEYGASNSHNPDRDPETTCGLGRFRPAGLQVFARIGAFIGVFSFTALLTSTLSVYINSQVSMLEKQFGFSSAQTGSLMAYNDIGYLCTVLFAGYLAPKVHIPRGLGVSAILFGVCGILCALPYFLQDSSVYAIGDSVPDANITRSVGEKVPVCEPGNYTVTTGDPCSESTEEGAFNLEQLWIKKVAYVLIAMGMVFQGIGKSPRYPFVTLYIDDAVEKRKTGFYMGVVIGLGIFGPALAYFVGGLFSRIYVTLESVEITTSDPRWVGAWWLGFIVFGAGAVIFAPPLMCFPRRLKSKRCHQEANTMEMKISKTLASGHTSTLKSFLKGMKDYGISVVRIFKSPSFTLLMLSTITHLLGVSGGLAFMPKYMASQYSLPLWKANIIIGSCSVLSVGIGAFVGGIVSRRVKMTPLNTCKMVLLFSAVYTAYLVVGFFLGCDQPVLHGDNSRHEPSPLYTLTDDHCNANCHCDEDSYFPICGDDGRAYYSPCHAGCISHSLTEFSNCSCIRPGHAIAGLCEQGCGNKLYIYAGVTFIGKLCEALKIIPVFIGKLRSVEERDRATVTAVQSFLTSTLGWMPGPVIFGAIIDNTCLLWKYTCGERQSCKLYDIAYFRNVLHGYVLTSSVLSSLLVVILYAYFKVTGITKWRGEMGEGGDKKNDRSLTEQLDQQIA